VACPGVTWVGVPFAGSSALALSAPNMPNDVNANRADDSISRRLQPSVDVSSNVGEERAPPTAPHHVRATTTPTFRIVVRAAALMNQL
jgi:hypothetical protein